MVQLQQKENVMLSAKAARAAIEVLAGGRFRNLEDKDAIQALVGSVADSQQSSVATFAVDTLLDCYDQGEKIFLKLEFESLGLALDIAIEFRVGPAAAERLIQTAAAAGFIGRFPELPRRLLGREMTPREVILLVDAYVQDTGCQSTSTEKELCEIARVFLPAQETAKQVGRIKRFAKDFADF